MKLTAPDIENLRAALAVCRVVGIELAVLRDGKILGVNDKRDAAIISQLNLSCPPAVKVGIGRVDELTKRVGLFGEGVEAELKVNDKSEVSQITLSAGRTKLQFRCTSMALLDRKYPQENVDTEAAVVSFTRAEVTQLSQGARTLGAETIVIRVSSAGEAHVECSDSNNDRFALTLESQAEFVTVPESTVFVYRAELLAGLLTSAAKDLDVVTVAIGEGGSLTCVLRNHTLIIMPQATGE
jgi:hypothetical protein